MRRPVSVFIVGFLLIIFSIRQLAIVVKTSTTNAGGKGEGLLEKLAPPSSSSPMNMAISTRTQMLFGDIGKRCGVLHGNNNNRHHRHHDNTTSETTFVVDTTTAANNKNSKNSTQKDWCASTFGRTWGEYQQLNKYKNDTLLKNEFPKECLPRIVRLSSHPTGGNGILRLLFRLNTGFFNGEKYPPDPVVKTSKATSKRNGNRRYPADIKCETMNHSTDNNGFTTNETTVDPNEYLAIPYTDNDIFIEKCHDVCAREKGGTSKTKSLQQQKQPPLPSHCIQLIRNPGDHLIRNSMRWKSLGGSGQYKNTNSPNKDEFIHQAKYTFCKSNSDPNSDKLIKMSEQWNDHYRRAYEYCRVRNRIPRRVVLYEHITNPAIAERVMEDLLSFVGYASTAGNETLQQQQQQQQHHYRHHVNYTAVIRVPTYDHGRLLLDACGIEFARRVHNLTKEVAVDFGYQFDFEKGVWIIP